jgi:hypothetical protein
MVAPRSAPPFRQVRLNFSDPPNPTETPLV